MAGGVEFPPHLADNVSEVAATGAGRIESYPIKIVAEGVGCPQHLVDLVGEGITERDTLGVIADGSVEGPPCGLLLAATETQQ